MIQYCKMLNIDSNNVYCATSYCIAHLHGKCGDRDFGVTWNMNSASKKTVHHPCLPRFLGAVYLWFLCICALGLSCRNQKWALIPEFVVLPRSRKKVLMLIAPNQWKKRRRIQHQKNMIERLNYEAPLTLLLIVTKYLYVFLSC